MNEDAVAMYNNWAADEEVTRFLMWPAHSTLEVSQGVIENWVKQYINESYYHWVIVLKENGDEPIGDIAVVDMKEEIPILGRQVINRALNKLIEENNLPKVVFHSLRHSSITYKLKLNGGDMKSVQGDSGHARVKMVADVYSQIIDEDRRLNAQRFEEAFYSGQGNDTSGSSLPEESSKEQDGERQSRNY